MNGTYQRPGSRSRNRSSLVSASCNGNNRSLSGRCLPSVITDGYGQVLSHHERILVCADNFQGWAAGGTWDDFSFQETYDSRIGRMAIVAAEQWRDLALLFTSNELRSFPIEFFPQRSAARIHDPVVVAGLQR